MLRKGECGKWAPEQSYPISLIQLALSLSLSHTHTCTHTHTHTHTHTEVLQKDAESKVEAEKKALEEEIVELDSLIPDIESKVSKQQCTN